MKRAQAHIRSAHTAPEGPTAREVQIIALIAEGKTSKEIATALGIETKTADVHRYNLMGKLGLNGIADITRYAIAHGLVKMPLTNAQLGATFCEVLGT